MIAESKEVIKLAASCFGEHTRYKLNVSNPAIARIYALPKIHKTGEQMRPIISNINVPTYKISKYIVEEFGKLTQPHGFDVKNSYDFIKKIENVVVRPSEILVSFDIKAMFDNIPIDKALVCIRDWLISQVTIEKVDIYMKMVSTCMKQNCFSFNGKFYKQERGTAMGNPLSPFIANIYVASLEYKMSQNEVFPKTWVRYVDDIFAIIGKHQLRRVMNMLNSNENHPISFTSETEIENKLNFLDLTITRNELTNRLEFNIYRKPTATSRFIPSNSAHSQQHKRAAFHSMAYRLVNVPLSPKNYNTELTTIKNIANINGYPDKMVDDIVLAHKRKKDLRECTTLMTINGTNEPVRRVKITHHPIASTLLKRTLRNFNIEAVEVSNRKLCRLLGSTKDKIPDIDKSGIYSIKCSDPNCDKLYVGQTKRSIKTRFSEHFAHIKYNRPEKSSVADHVLSNNHSVCIDNLILLKTVTNPYQLDAYESLYIKKNLHNNVMNSDNGPIQSVLFS